MPIIASAEVGAVLGLVVRARAECKEIEYELHEYRGQETVVDAKVSI